MWIIRCVELATGRHFDVGPFGGDDQAEDAAAQLQADGRVSAQVELLVEPGRALAGATF